ncbi:tRNA (adenosine(37)-N6)-dimethylallyltransferase MiaA [Nodosilinea sp. LEGE 07088]|uniref:tRNA (adenosine(37)-N6)-dimethylallyltransferase MiaA n=1 Tax=Nodosilinea sp. LEGE 07088 TaxID=2777968 RepID=UPI00187F4565|nr:tRNA (adenosine(37)-N6)-dimethylallyltransferase MiaA [Nodosilinea sp. LEGE 07088]MBE9136105.1 tRNA (adenosine(37)-N6)-dimethylallyltransferase MiaA [Nodosilinea sp. LEGE 07088]
MQLPKFSQLKPQLQNQADYSSIVPLLLVIGGATATGKSALAIALAQRLGGVILSADSRQVYREFDIGTAKPSQFDQAQVPHYLIDICDPTATLTLAQYQGQAQAIIDRLHRDGIPPLLVGGTGLYIDAIVKGLRIPPVAPQPDLRQQFEALGQPHCYALLQKLDGCAAQRIHPNDPVRTVRALEVYYVTGQPMSALQGESPPSYPVLYLGLDADITALDRRIAQRTQAMVEAGLVEEVTALAQRYGADLPLLQTLGYGEMLPYLQGDCSLAAAVDHIVLHTRQFAKRQRTWFRNRATVQWFDADAGDLVERVWQEVQDWCQVNLP